MKPTPTWCSIRYSCLVVASHAYLARISGAGPARSVGSVGGPSGFGNSEPEEEGAGPLGAAETTSGSPFSALHAARP